MKKKQGEFSRITIIVAVVALLVVVSVASYFVLKPADNRPRPIPISSAPTTAEQPQVNAETQDNPGMPPAPIIPSGASGASDSTAPAMPMIPSAGQSSSENSTSSAGPPMPVIPR